MENGKYKIDSVKLAKLDYFDSYNSSYWDGKPREKIEIEAVGLTADDYNAYLDYKVDKDEHNPFNKIDTYLQNSISKEKIIIDIQNMKEKYPNDEYWKKGVEEIYNDVNIEINKLYRVEIDPGRPYNADNIVNLPKEQALNAIAAYRKLYPNDKLFYGEVVSANLSVNDASYKLLGSGTDFDVEEYIKNAPVPLNLRKDLSGNYVIIDTTTLKEKIVIKKLTNEEVLELLKDKAKEPSISGPNYVNKWTLYGSSSFDPESPTNSSKIKYYLDNNVSDEEILSDYKIMKRKYSNEPFFKQSDEDALTAIKSSVGKMERFYDNPMVFFSDASNEVLFSKDDMLTYIQSYREKYPNDGIFFSSIYGEDKTQILGEDAIDKTHPLSNEQVLQIILDKLETRGCILDIPVENVEELDIEIPKTVDISKFNITFDQEDYYNLKLYDDEIDRLDGEIDKIDDEIDKIDELWNQYEYIECNNTNPEDYAEGCGISFDALGNVILEFESSTGRVYSFTKEQALNRKRQLQNAKTSLENEQKLVQFGKNTYINSVMMPKLKNGSTYIYFDQKYNITSGEKLYEWLKETMSTSEVEQFDQEVIFNMDHDQATMFFYLYANLDFANDGSVVENFNNIEAAKEYYNLIKDEVQMYAAAKLAKQWLDDWTDEEGNVNADFWDYLDANISSMGEFKDHIISLFNPNEDGEVSTKDIAKYLFAEALTHKNEAAGTGYKLSQCLGKNSIPLGTAAILTATGHPELGANICYALYGMETAANTRLSALRSGHTQLESYGIGLAAGGLDFFINTYGKKLLFKSDTESLIRNIIACGSAKGVSAGTTYIFDKWAANEEIKVTELFEKGIEGYVIGIVIGVISHHKFKVIKRDGTPLILDITEQERGKLAEWFATNPTGMSMKFLLTQLPPKLLIALKDIIRDAGLDYDIDAIIDG